MSQNVVVVVVGMFVSVVNLSANVLVVKVVDLNAYAGVVNAILSVREKGIEMTND